MPLRKTMSREERPSTTTPQSTSSLRKRVQKFLAKFHRISKSPEPAHFTVFDLSCTDNGNHVSQTRRYDFEGLAERHIAASKQTTVQWEWRRKTEVEESEVVHDPWKTVHDVDIESYEEAYRTMTQSCRQNRIEQV